MRALLCALIALCAFVGAVHAQAPGAAYGSVTGYGTTLPSFSSGTWTPTVTTSGTVGTPAYTAQVGTYEEFGFTVIARFTIILSGWSGSPSGNVSVAGFPTTADATTNNYESCVVSYFVVSGLAASNYNISGYIAPATNTMLLLQNGNTTSAAITAAQAGTTPTFIGMCIYRSHT